MEGGEPTLCKKTIIAARAGSAKSCLLAPRSFASPVADVEVMYAAQVLKEQARMNNDNIHDDSPRQ